MICPLCEQGNLQSRGVGNNVKKYQCNKCRQWVYEKINPNSSEIEYGRDFINVICSAERVLNEKDIRQQFQISPDEWHLDKLKVKTSEGYRKDRSVEWEVSNGQVTKGEVHDSGKMLVVPLYHVSATFIRKTQEIRARFVVNELKEDALRLAPRYKPIKYPKLSGHLMYEIMMPDLQLGRLVAEEATGKESNPELSVKRADESVTELLTHIKDKPIEKILFPVGNDFFDANTAEMMTVHGTPQLDDVRWTRTFTLGKNLMIDLIEKLMMIAPVELLLVPGNHDEERVWHLGDTLESRFYKAPNVKVDNRIIKRKYFQYNRCMIGFTHGYYERIESLGGLMPSEAPKVWADTNHHEFHLGDRHHKKDIILKTQELENGVVVRLFRSLADPSVWEFDKGLTGSLKAAEGILWHPTKGVIGQFTASPDYK